MWCVSELDEAYIACMEDVLETYDGRTIRRNRWFVWMRSR